MKNTKQKEQRYKVVNYGTGLGMEAYGDSPVELFKNAALGLFSVIVDAKEVKAEKGKRLELIGHGDLLALFLDELLKMWDEEGFIPSDFSMRIEDDRLTGNIIGGVFNPVEHTLKQEVKAITCEEFSTDKNEKNCEAGIILYL